MAKTQYSLSDNAKVLGAPKGFKIHVREFVPKLMVELFDKMQK